MLRKFNSLVKATAVASCLVAPMLSSFAHAEKWDMPMAYSATNFHSEKGVEFADKVRKYTNGKVDITVGQGDRICVAVDVM